MSLSKNEPRRFRRPDGGGEDAEVAARPLHLTAGLPGAVMTMSGGGRAVRPAPTDNGVTTHRRDAARIELERVLEIRGRPISYYRGKDGKIYYRHDHRPSPAFRTAAQAYIIGHHRNFCIQYARRKAARHVQVEDLVQAAITGAYIALERYDPDHETAWRFLSYAKWYMLCECNRLLNSEECLVVVPDTVRQARSKLANACPADVSDEDAAELLDMHLADVRAARTAHLGHEHRTVDEKNRVCRRGLADARESHEHRVTELSSHHDIDRALSALDPLLRQVLFLEYGVGTDQGVPPPRTDQSRRSLRNLALRRIREELEA